MITDPDFEILGPMKQPTASTRALQQASETQTEGSRIALHSNVDDTKGQTGVLGLLSEERLAAELGRSTATLRRWRRQGIGPPFISGVGRDIWYRVETVEAWLISREQGSVPDAPTPGTPPQHRRRSSQSIRHGGRRGSCA
jgi:Helix-turn-helix domain